MKFITILIYFFIISSVLFANDYSFEIPADESKKEALELSGNLDVKYLLFNSDKSSPIYNLQYFNQKLSNSLSSYYLAFYLNGDYQTKNIGVHLKTYSEYYNDNQTDFKVFELYGNLNFSLNTTLIAGKKMYNWGKGYAFNPVGYVNSKKDPENPELAQAGVFSINYQYSKSFQSEIIKNAAFDLIVIPSATTVNNKISETRNTDIAGKIDFLFCDADIDFLWYYSNTNSKNIGFDFSKNITPNLEFHGEFNRFNNLIKNSIFNNTLESNKTSGLSYLFGIRWLNKSDITTIFEYYHNDKGLTKNEFRDYNNFLINAAASMNNNTIANALNTNKNYFSGANLMCNYLYLKVSKPEPFKIIYFTPSIYSIYNIDDRSFTVGAPLSYKPITNFEFIFSPVFFNGGKNTEFGGKQYDSKLELWAKYFF